MSFALKNFIIDLRAQNNIYMMLCPSGGERGGGYRCFLSTIYTFERRALKNH